MPGLGVLRSEGTNEVKSRRLGIFRTDLRFSSRQYCRSLRYRLPHRAVRRFPLMYDVESAAYPSHQATLVSFFRASAVSPVIFPLDLVIARHLRF
jgi:hypothetical protein